MSSKLFPGKSKHAWKKKANKAGLAALAPPKPFQGAQNPVPDLSAFILSGWHVLEPSTRLEWNWHIPAVSDHLQAAIEDWMAVQKWLQNQQDLALTAIVGKGGPSEAAKDSLTAADHAPLQRIKNLIINIPPGTAKSRIVSVFLPAWVWLKWPSFKFLCLSANPRVATRDSVYCRDLIESKWYKETFKPDWDLKKDQNGKTSFWNTAGGFRSAFGFDSRITGDRADAIVWDDPHDADEVHSETLRQRVLDRWDNAIGNRVNDLRSSLRIGVMQRLHEEDLAGHLLTKGGWEHLCLPMEFEASSACQCPSCVRGHTAVGWFDPRLHTEEKLLFPSRFTREVLDEELKRLGSAGYAGQMQQRPAPAGGEIFNQEWWRFWVPKGITLPPKKFRRPDGSYFEAPTIELPDDDDFEEVLQSWDMTFKDTKASDFVAGGCWARMGSRRFLLDQVRDRMSFTKTVNAVVEFTALWPAARRKLIEDKANGPAVISSLSGKVAGMVAIEPDGTKIARAHAVTPDIEGGDVYLPHPSLPGYGWVEAFLAECTAFPFGAKDDQVDQMTQALKYWIVGKKRKGKFF